MKAPFAKPAEELGPEHFVFGVTYVEIEDFSVAVSRHPGCHDDRVRSAATRRANTPELRGVIDVKDLRPLIDADGDVAALVSALAHRVPGHPSRRGPVGLNSIWA